MQDIQSIIDFLNRERESALQHCPVDESGAMILANERPMAMAAYLRAHYLQTELEALENDKSKGEGGQEDNHWGQVCSDLVGLLGDFNTSPSSNADDNGYSPEALEKLESNYQQRIKNLEKYRKLFFDLSDRLNELKGPDENKQAPVNPADLVVKPLDREVINAPLNSLKSSQEDQSELVTSLQAKVKELQANEAHNEEQIAENLEMLQQLDRQLQESKGCTSMLEEEVDRLMDQADALKEENQSLKAKLVLQESSELAQPDSFPEQEDGEDASAPKPETLVVAEKKITALDAELEQTTEMAFGFMKNCADLGSVVQFLIDSLDSGSEKTLTDALFSSLETMSLNAAVLITKGKEVSFYSSSADLRVSKKSKIWAAKSKSRLVSSDAGLLLLGENAKMFIDTADVDDAATIDRLKDNVQKLSLGLDAAVSKLLNDNSKLANHQRLETMVKLTDGACNTFGDAVQSHVGDMRDLLSSFITESKQLLVSIEMDNKDKNQLLQFVTESSNTILNKTADTLSLDKDFRTLLKRLRTE